MTIYLATLEIKTASSLWSGQLDFILPASLRVTQECPLG